MTAARRLAAILARDMAATSASGGPLPANPRDERDRCPRKLPSGHRRLPALSAGSLRCRRSPVLSGASVFKVLICLGPTKRWFESARSHLTLRFEPSQGVDRQAAENVRRGNPRRKSFSLFEGSPSSVAWRGASRPDRSTLSSVFNERSGSAHRSPSRPPSRTEIGDGCARGGRSTSRWPPS